jgi:hypothetical protein
MDPVFLVRNSFGCSGSTNQKPVTDADGTVLPMLAAEG